MCCIIYSTPIDRTRDVSFSLFHPYRQDPWCVVFFIPPLSTRPVMCRFLYSSPIDRTRSWVVFFIPPFYSTSIDRTCDVSYYLFHPYRQDLWCVVLFIPPLSTGPVMCRIIYSTPIDRTRDVSLAQFPFNQRAVKRSSPRATRGYQNEARKGRLCCCSKI